MLDTIDNSDSLAAIPIGIDDRRWLIWVNATRTRRFPAMKPASPEIVLWHSRHARQLQFAMQLRAALRA